MVNFEPALPAAHAACLDNGAYADGYASLTAHAASDSAISARIPASFLPEHAGTLTGYKQLVIGGSQVDSDRLSQNNATGPMQ